MQRKWSLVTITRNAPKEMSATKNYTVETRTIKTMLCDETTTARRKIN